MQTVYEDTIVAFIIELSKTTTSYADKSVARPPYEERRTMEFVATCPKGLERLLSRELASLGLTQVRALTGQVTFVGALEDGYRACLWSRIASRIICIFERIDAADSDALYEGVNTIAWEDHIPRGVSIAVDAHGTNDNLRNTQFIALRTKDGIADRMLSRAGVRVATDPANPDLRIACRLHEQRAAIGIDLSGDPLFRRGWESSRKSNFQLPQLRADYAAALLAYGQWFRNCRHEKPSLVVGCAGAGSLVIEGAAQALDRAPGLLRPRWGFDAWINHDKSAWDDLYTEAQTRFEQRAQNDVHIIACDTRRGWESAIHSALRSAGIAIEPTLIATDDTASLGQAIADLPSVPLALIDATLSEPDNLPLQASLLASASTIAEALPPTVPLVAISSDSTLDAALRCNCHESNEILFGRGKATLRSYDLSERKGNPVQVIVGDNHTVPVLIPTSNQFASRLTKKYRRLRKWARREDIHCYRVYDADLPDYAVSIDLFEGIARPSKAAGGALVPSGRWCLISEYAAPSEVDVDLARKRLLDVLAIAPEVLNVATNDVRIRIRTRSKGGSQYSEAPALSQRKGQQSQEQKVGGKHRRPKLIEEGGLVFEVNFDDYLDCGIFLDHRETRAMIRELAKRVPANGRFCNLFAYTGTATCYAADGGVSRTTTVDLSKTYLDWAQRNMHHNGFTDETHRFVQADVLSWVSDQRHKHEHYDLVFCDPPTFSNSSRMRKRSFDVQRDHTELLINISRILSPEGVCVFSCNLRSFKPDIEKLTRAGVEIEDITKQTIPEDFARNPKVHHCYLVKHAPRPSQHKMSQKPGANTAHKKAPRPAKHKYERNFRMKADKK